ncbi:MAG: AAA family ATPase [Anaerolineales bacterium]|nr:AAA family ATPase [Anaerolineales bacterium]
MAKLEIATLGPLQITIDHAPVSGFLSDKVRALLVYLAVEQARPLRREALAALFWSEHPKGKALANLRRALANLRQVIDDENGRFLRITRQSLQFNPNSKATIDLRQFYSLLAGSEPTLAHMEEAVKMANGRFLDGFSINDSIAFEEWALLQREKYQRRLLKTLHQITTQYENQHQAEKAVRFAWQQVNIEPWYEPGQRQLMRLLAQTGQRATALAHFAQFQQELKTELGVLPEPATRRLYEQIQQRAETATAAGDSTTPFWIEAPAISHQPFVSREPELARLHHFLATAVTHQAQFAFITGEAGSGKTSLLHTFAQQAQHQNSHLIPLSSSSPAHLGPGNPYRLVRSLLAHALGDLEPLWRDGSLSRAQVARLWSLRRDVFDCLEETAPDCLHALVDAALLPKDRPLVASEIIPVQEVLFEQLARFLQQLSQRGPLLLMLDDLHWADSVTLDLLFYLRQKLIGYPILLLGTYRPEELLTANHQHPLAKFIRSLTHDFGQIEVPLNQADGRSFIDAWLDVTPNQLNEAFRQTLFRQTKGHALFTVELVKALQERGDLHQDNQGCWLARETVSWNQLPAKTEAIIAERANRLPAALQQLLEIASVQGNGFNAEIVAQVGQRPLSDTIHALSNNLARQHNLIQPLGRQQIEGHALPCYRFRHSLFQQYFYNSLDPVERAHLHQHTAEALAELYETAVTTPSPLAADLAHHFEAAQNISQAIQYRQLAGQHALTLSAHAAAAEHFRHSLTLLATQPNTPDRSQQEIDCQLALGASLLALNGYANPQVKATYDHAYELCCEVEAAPEMVTSLFWLTSYYAVSGDLLQAVHVSEQMLAVVAQHPVSDMHRMQAHVLSGLPLFFLGKNVAALAHFQRASAMYDPARHQPFVYTFGQDPGIAAMMWQGHVLLHMGNLTKAKRCLQQALAWSAKLDHSYTATFTQLLAGGTPNLWYVWDLETAKQHVETAVKLAKEGNFAQMLALGTFYQGYILVATFLQQGDECTGQKVAEGFILMQQGMAMEAEVGSKLGLSSRWLILADAYRQCDQIEQAWHALQLAEVEVYGRQELYFEAEILRLKGELYLLAGNVPQAEASWQEAILSARQQKAKVWEHRAETALQRLWQAQEIRQHL